MKWRIVRNRKGGLKRKKPWLLQYGKVRTTINNFTRWKTKYEWGYDTKEEAKVERDKQNTLQKIKESRDAKDSL